MWAWRQLAAWELNDRGLIRTRFAADLMLFDEQNVRPGMPVAKADFPGGVSRADREFVSGLGNVGWSFLLRDGSCLVSGSGRISPRRTRRTTEGHGEGVTSQTMNRRRPSLRRSAWKFIRRPTRI